MYPKLKILKSKEFDKIICEQFLNVQKGGVDFGAGIINVHPRLVVTKSTVGDETRKIISDYFDDFYIKFDSDIRKKIKRAEKEWKIKENIFFKACDKYFNNHKWPEGRYEAYLSIINCNPRFLENKTFQFYWKNKDNFSSVAVHEMLHFLFYDLVVKLLPNTDLQSQKIWEISEVFNGLIMTELDFVDITNVKKPRQYPNLVNLQEELQGIWNENKMTDKFILSTLS
jgi:hypothetical protein